MRAVSARRGARIDQARRARFEQLFGEVYAPLQRYVRRRVSAADADDVVADALLVAWRRLDEVPADATVAWVYGVARNCVANRHRSTARAERLTLRVADAVRTESQLPLSGVADDPALDSAMARLGDADREVLRLWAWEQLTASEMAIVLGTTANGVSIRLHRAKQRLGELLVGERKNEPRNGHVSHEHGEEEQ